MVAFAVALAVGIIAGLRAMTGAAAAAWAAYLGVLPVTGTWLAWLVSPWAVGIVTLLALVELVTDQLPSTPSRKIPVQFGTRVLIGAVAGAAFGVAGVCRLGRRFQGGVDEEGFRQVEGGFHQSRPPTPQAHLCT